MAGMLGTMFGRAAAAGGGAVAALSNRYIDEEMQQNKATFIAELQRTSAANIRADDDAFKNDPARIARDRENARQSTMLTAATQDQIEAGRLDPAGPLAQAKATDAERKAEADRQRKLKDLEVVSPAEARVEAERQRMIAEAKAAQDRADAAAYAADPQARAGTKALAKDRHVTGVGEAAQAELARFQLGVARRTADLQDTLQRAVVTGDRGLEEQTRAQLDVVNGKPGNQERAAAVAESAAKVINQAQKILADSLASPEAKADAQQTIDEQRKIMNHFATKAGVDMTTSKLPPPAAIDLLFKLRSNPKAVSDFDSMFGAGSAAIVLGEEDTAQGKEGKSGPGRDGRQMPKAAGARPADAADRATAQRVAAESDMQRWGSRQRQQDPEGFQAAQRALQEARQAEEAAFRDVPADGRPAFRMPTP